MIILATCEMMSQHKLNGILWDKENKIPVEYATLHNSKDYAVSNSEGKFYIESVVDSLMISNLNYEVKTLTISQLTQLDTIFLSPKTFHLEEVVVNPADLYSQIGKAIVANFAFEPHKEHFYLRAMLRRNGKIEKIVDLAGILEKKTLFVKKGMSLPKKNYTIQLENFRKAGIINREYDFQLQTLNSFMQFIATVNMIPEHYHYSRSVMKDSILAKVETKPKKTTKTKSEGYYLIDNKTNITNQVHINYNNPDEEFKQNPILKSRNPQLELTTDFKKNPQTGKYQLSKSIIYAKTEVIINSKTDIWEEYYYYEASPIPITIAVKNNINQEKDIFELEGKYEANYWDKNEKLILTQEMQDFIDQLPKNTKNESFRVKTNVK